MLWTFYVFNNLLFLLAPAVTNMLGACHSLIVTMKSQHGDIVENCLHHVNDTTIFSQLTDGSHSSVWVFAATLSAVIQKTILGPESHLNLTKKSKASSKNVLAIFTSISTKKFKSICTHIQSLLVIIFESKTLSTKPEMNISEIKIVVFANQIMISSASD